MFDFCDMASKEAKVAARSMRRDAKKYREQARDIKRKIAELEQEKIHENFPIVQERILNFNAKRKSKLNSIELKKSELRKASFIAEMLDAEARTLEELGERSHYGDSRAAAEAISLATRAYKSA